MVIKKITFGFVIQEIDVDLESRSCKIISQEFMNSDWAGDEWEDVNGEILTNAEVDNMFSNFENGVPYFPITIGDVK